MIARKRASGRPAEHSRRAAGGNEPSIVVMGATVLLALRPYD
jgi:hypothetical protein